MRISNGICVEIIITSVYLNYVVQILDVLPDWEYRDCIVYTKCICVAHFDIATQLHH